MYDKIQRAQKTGTSRDYHRDITPFLKLSEVDRCIGRTRSHQFKQLQNFVIYLCIYLFRREVRSQPIVANYEGPHYKTQEKRNKIRYKKE